jgi:hypothetical protein
MAGWCNFYYPETWGPNNQATGRSTAEREARANMKSGFSSRYRSRLSVCVQCRQARDICKELARGPDGTGGLEGNTPWLVGGIPDRVSNDNLDYVAEFDLGLEMWGNDGCVCKHGSPARQPA